MKKIIECLFMSFGFAAVLAGCSQPNAAPGSTSSPTVAIEPAQSFNPTVTPPPAPAATEAVKAYQGYYFNPAPAPVPEETPIRIHHRHRYLHLIYRDGECYLADNYGNVYHCGRDDNGNYYPIYQDPVTGADYPLYYDSERDEYYRCVDDGDNGYYRNYCGDPDNDFYKGDPDQEEECESDQCQPFIINIDFNYDDYRGYNPQYAYYDGPHYHRHDHSFFQHIPVIVAAYIVLQPSGNNGGGGYGGGGRTTIHINNHNYYQSPVVVARGGNAAHGLMYAAVPGPPIGHFQGYRGGAARNYGAASHSPQQTVREQNSPKMPMPAGKKAYYAGYQPNKPEPPITSSNMSANSRGERQKSDNGGHAQPGPETTEHHGMATGAALDQHGHIAKVRMAAASHTGVLPGAPHYSGAAHPLSHNNAEPAHPGMPARQADHEKAVRTQPGVLPHHTQTVQASGASQAAQHQQRVQRNVANHQADRQQEHQFQAPVRQPVQIQHRPAEQQWQQPRAAAPQRSFSPPQQPHFTSQPRASAPQQQPHFTPPQRQAPVQQQHFTPQSRPAAPQQAPQPAPGGGGAPRKHH